MLNNDIYTSALALLSESLSVRDNGDFTERAPYIIAMFICESQGLDASLRSFSGLSAVKEYNTVYADLSADFPLLERFSAPASLYLASMLIADEDSERSERLFEKYCDSISSVAAHICGKSESITDKYFED